MNMWWIVLAETLAVSVIGSLLHFTYAWSGRNKFVAIFAAVNESTWEHIKLALSGTFVCMLVDVWWLGDSPNYWLARNLSFVVPVVVIPILFYGYHSIWKVKKSILPVDIMIFMIAAFLSALVFVLVLQAPAIGATSDMVSMVISIMILAAYLLLTKFPLHNFLFEDPITHKYGIEKRNRKV